MLPVSTWPALPFQERSHAASPPCRNDVPLLPSTPQAPADTATSGASKYLGCSPMKELFRLSILVSVAAHCLHTPHSHSVPFGSALGSSSSRAGLVPVSPMQIPSCSLEACKCFSVRTNAGGHVQVSRSCRSCAAHTVFKCNDEIT